MLKRKVTIPNLPKPVFIIVHHSGNNAGLYSVNEYHRQLWGFKSVRGFFVGYGYWIDYAGKITQTRDDREEQAHCRSYNKVSIGIALQGNLNKTEPTQWQLQALSDLIDKKKKEYGIKNNMIKGHREMRGYRMGDCPGNKLYSWLCGKYPDVA